MTILIKWILVINLTITLIITHTFSNHCIRLIFYCILFKFFLLSDLIINFIKFMKYSITLMDFWIFHADMTCKSKHYHHKIKYTYHKESNIKASLICFCFLIFFWDMKWFKNYIRWLICYSYFFEIFVYLTLGILLLFHKLFKTAFIFKSNKTLNWHF